MRLTIKALDSFFRNNRLKARIALEMDISIASLNRWTDNNDQNGPLTTAKVLQIIQEETGLERDEILEDEKVSETN